VSVPQEEIEAAAAAIANARGARRGVPAVANILEVLQGFAGGKLYREVMQDAEAALEAAARVREANRLKNCKHDRAHGSGMLGGPDGYIDWHCDDCGKSWRAGAVSP
jgi:hypothetical protein